MTGNLIGLSINNNFVSCEIQCDFNFDVEMRSASAIDSGRWKEVIAGVRSWGMTVSGKLLLATVPSDFKSILLGALMTGETVYLQWRTLNDDFIISGYALPNSGSISAPRNEAVNWNLGFTGTGALNPGGNQPEPGVYMKYGFVNFDPNGALTGISDMLQFSKPVYSGDNLLNLDFTKASAGYWLVVEYSLDEPIFNKWDNNGLNYGDIPDFSWALPVSFGGKRYYYTTKREYITAVNSAIKLFKTSNTPDQFYFIDITGALPSTQYVSNAITVSGLGSGEYADISIDGGGLYEYQINGSFWTYTITNVFNGDSIRVRLTTSAGSGVTTSATLTIGGVSDAYSVTTS